MSAQTEHDGDDSEDCCNSGTCSAGPLERRVCSPGPQASPRCVLAARARSPRAAPALFLGASTGNRVEASSQQNRFTVLIDAHRETIQQQSLTLYNCASKIGIHLTNLTSRRSGQTPDDIPSESRG